MKNKNVNKKKTKKNAAEELAGIHIYKDDHNRYVYYDIFSKCGYVINNVQSYKVLANRFMFGLVSGVLVATFDLGQYTLWLSLGLGIAIYLFMEFKFRSYLKRQTMLMNFQPKQRPPRVLTAAGDETKRIYLKIALYFAFAILIIIMAFMEQKYDLWIKIACVLVGIGAGALAIFNIYALSYKKKNNIEDYK